MKSGILIKVYRVTAVKWSACIPVFAYLYIYLISICFHVLVETPELCVVDGSVDITNIPRIMRNDSTDLLCFCC